MSDHFMDAGAYIASHRPGIASSAPPGIQVWGGNRLLGWLNRAIPASTNILEIAVMPEDELTYISPGTVKVLSARKIRLVKNKRSAVIDKHVVRDGGPGVLEHFRMRHNIPADAVTVRCPENFEIRFTWNILAVSSIEDYEKVFDLPDFEPA